MEKDIFDIIQEKEYNQLNSAEMAELVDFCASEEEFLQMKSVLVNVHAMKIADVAAPKPQVKQKLDDLFVAQSFTQTSASAVSQKGLMAVLYPKNKKLYERPLFQIAAVLILILGVLPFLLKNELPVKEQLAKLEKKKEDSTTTRSPVSKEKNVQKTKELLKNGMIDQEEATSDAQSGPEINFYNSIQPAPSVSTISRSNNEALELTMAEAKSAESPGESIFDHSDGIFEGAVGELKSFSKPLSEQPEVLDLLTASF